MTIELVDKIALATKIAHRLAADDDGGDRHCTECLDENGDYE